VQGSGNSNFVWGNFIGTNAAGTAAIRPIANPGIVGFVGVSLSGSNSLIGGTSPGAGNVISGNRVGIEAGNTIQGNLIGTDVTGTIRVPNFIGIFSPDGRNMVIGGQTSGARNVISGNDYGVEVIGTVQVQGNFIGTDITGTVALGNGQGVVTGNGALIGGPLPEARNVISGNGRNVALTLGVAVNIQNNYIGTDVTGTRALGGEGIFILTEYHSITHNVISGNAHGILAGQSFLIFGQGNHMVIQDNLIGLNAQGTGPLPNDADGILLQAGSSNNSITANKIAFNGRSGIIMDGGTGNLIRGNSIFSNGELGIALSSPFGVTPNDPADTDIGSNNLQNFPVITSALSVGSSTMIQGSLNSTPNTTFQIDFYSNAALDPSGYGEGALFIGTTPVTTDQNGDATINVTLPIALGIGRAVTATATDPNGNTSEFSAGDVTSLAGNVQFSMASIRVIEDVGLLTVTVLRKGGSAGTLTIDYGTVDGTATAGQDYTGTSGTLVFNAGETSKSFQIPILDDEVSEPDEKFTVTFRNPPSLEAVGAPSSLVVTVQDRATVPVILQNFVSVAEGNVGSSAEALFSFTLSAATGKSVSADYATSDLSARGGSSCGDQGTDYETTSGTISFQPGDTSSVTIPIKICGDTSAEGSEDFRVNFSNLVNATPDPNPYHGIATIVDDDKLELLLEEDGPINYQAAALDAVLFLRDPFRVTMPEWFPTGPDHNTRVMFFVRGLQLDPGEVPSAVVVYFGANFQSIGVPAEDVRPVPNVDFVQVVVRLPDNLPENVYSVHITVHNKSSNSGQIRIVL
jgi:parallel beta-helix repeat protein